ncbi:hypothetical protein ASPTUDRAFT_45826 [Aspergillus tubingensis CBS 134.48]|uniref:Uncharacterized protein n=1 Tax=Aspergillus tubingensis (strain CBS 134.48) TaxID=767770 RepID=A0A1L9MZA6_ASPTC|nr:hypothetical protein ASPTUDRAFT_45826 [Aspergillus tubingensis CBS 134.48]
MVRPVKCFSANALHGTWTYLLHQSAANYRRFLFIITITITISLATLRLWILQAPMSTVDY